MGIITEYLSARKDSEWSATHLLFLYSSGRSTFSGGEYATPSLNGKYLFERTPYPGSSSYRRYVCVHSGRYCRGQQWIAARPVAEKRRRQPAAGPRVRRDGGGQPDQPEENRDRHERGSSGGRVVRGRELRWRRNLGNKADRGQRQPGRRMLRPQPVVRQVWQPLHDLPLQRRDPGAY